MAATSLHFNFLFVPCGRLSWLPVSFLLHVKHTLSYLSYRNNKPVCCCYPPFASIAKGEVFVLLYVFLFFLFFYPPFARAKGEVFVLLLLFCTFFCQRFLDNPQANSRQILHAGVLWFRMCLLPFWGLAAPGGQKKGEMKFLLLWESMGNFCILAVFERYLSNACTDPHQILFV